MDDGVEEEREEGELKEGAAENDAKKGGGVALE